MEKDIKKLNEKIDKKFDMLERLLFVYAIRLTTLITGIGIMILFILTT